MALRLLRHTQWIALLAACASSAACGSSKPPPPDAFVAASVLDTSSGTCNFHSAQVIVNIGADPTADAKPETIANGGSVMGGQSVTVTCSVIASGSGFNIQLSAEQNGVGGGSLTITSPSGMPLDPVNGGTVSASWTNLNVGTYDESDCMLTYAFQGGTVPSSAGPPIAAGRIWAHVSCPTATDSQQSPAPVCDGEADILFENCAQ